MPDQKAEILKEFDQLISDLKALIAQIPDYSHDRDNRGITEYISPENREKYINLRTRCLMLLNSIESEDAKLKAAIDFIGDTDVLLWNIRTTLEKMQSLRAEFATDLLTRYPRLPDTASQRNLISKGKGHVHPETKLQKRTTILAVISSIALGVGTYLLLDNSSLIFLADHKQRIPLQVFAGLIVFLVILGILRPKWRVACWGFSLLPVIIGAVQLLGR